MKKNMEEPRRVLYGKLTDKLVGTKSGYSWRKVRFVSHLNAFNKLVTWLVSVDEKIEKNDKFINLASFLPSS